MRQGTVTSISSHGFGFIEPDRSSGEVWVRPRSVSGETPLLEGQRVEFDLAFGTLGVEAANVQPLQP